MLPLQEDERAPQQAVAEGLTRRAEHRGDGRAHVPWRMLGDGHLQACVVAASALAVCGRPRRPWPFDPALVVRVPLGASELTCLRAQHLALRRAGEAVENEERVTLHHSGCWSRCCRCAGPVDECLAPGCVTGGRPCLCRAGLLVRRRYHLTGDVLGFTRTRAVAAMIRVVGCLCCARAVAAVLYERARAAGIFAKCYWNREMRRNAAMQ